MKERIKEKLNERLELILSKEIKDVTSDEFIILSNEFSKLEYEEGKEERDKEFAELIAKNLVNRR